MRYLPLYIWPMTFVITYLLAAGAYQLVLVIHHRLVTGSI